MYANRIIWAFALASVFCFSARPAFPIDNNQEASFRTHIVERLSGLRNFLAKEVHQSERFLAAINGAKDTQRFYEVIRSFNRTDGIVVSSFVRSLAVDSSRAGALSLAPAIGADEFKYIKRQAIEFIEAQQQMLQGNTVFVAKFVEAANSKPVIQLFDELAVTGIPKSLREIIYGADAADGSVNPHIYSQELSFLPYIVGPSSRPTTDFPAVGELLYDDGVSGAIGICTATLIGPNVVLTAAHCICDNPGLNDGAKLRTYKRCQSAQYTHGDHDHNALSGYGYRVFFQHAGLFNIATDGVVLKKEYKWPFADVAILFLEKPVDSIKPAQLNRTRTLRIGQRGTIVGFGWHNPLNSVGRPKRFDQLVKSVGIKVYASINTTSCDQASKSSSLICWDYSDKERRNLLGSTCRGDSGGPLFATIDDKHVLVGVTSSGQNCRFGDKPKDTEVFLFHPWIDSEISRRAKKEKVARKSGQLAAISNPTDRYPFFVLYEMFRPTPVSWTGSFRVPSSFKTIRMGINATPNEVLPSADKLRMKILDDSSGEVLCDVISANVVNFCRIERAGSRTLTVFTSGAAYQRFQLVATGF